MEDGAKQHLREWLIAQIDSGRYEGLCWEHEDRSMFRIPWKHAAKKDYKQSEDAALFKAWAVYKGKYREGRDRADPTMWKTRLRCALNKSTDFQEVPERNQLDISEPYKVYRIQPDAGSPRPVESLQIKGDVIIHNKMSPPSPEVMDEQVNEEEKASSDVLMKEHLYCELKEPPAATSILSPGHKVTDFRLQVSLYYLGEAMMSVTTSSPDGCFLLWGQAPLGNEQIYGRCTAQQISFPSPEHASLPTSVAETMNRLFVHLERGVLVWVGPDGVFIKRFCQGRVYWSGPLAKHTDRPNKLERDKTFKLLDVTRFISELQMSSQGKGPVPAHEIQLCFGEEYPDPQVPKSRKLIMAKVVPLFAAELLQKVMTGESEESRKTQWKSKCSKDGERMERR